MHYLRYLRALIRRSLRSNKAHFQEASRATTGIRRKQGIAGLKFLEYLSSYLSSRAFWMQWSRAGIIAVAELLGIPVEKVPRTTNHLESHNNHLKGDYFADHCHGGRLPRIDEWIIILVTQVIPDFFFRRENTRALEEHRAYLRTVPQHANSRSSVLGSPPPPHLRPASLAAIPPCAQDLQLTQLEAELMKTMLEDDLAEGTDSSSVGSPLAGSPGKSVDADSDLSLGAHSDDSGWADAIEIALGPSQILPDLTALPSSPLSTDNSPPPCASDLYSQIPEPPTSLPDTSNARVIAMQELLNATDECASALRRLRGLGEPAATLAPYISPYNERFFADSSFTHSVLVGDLSVLSDGSSSASSGSGSPFILPRPSSPPIPSRVEFAQDLLAEISPTHSFRRWEPVDGVNPELAELLAEARGQRQDRFRRASKEYEADVLVPLEKQRKEARKPSYNQR